jgi:hypothetical protein
MNNSNAKRRSLMKIGLVVRLAELPETGKAPSYAEIRQTALKAEKGGFDSIWLYDHLLYRNEEKTTGIWECWTMMSALAEATSQVEIGSLVLCTASAIQQSWPRWQLPWTRSAAVVRLCLSHLAH